MSSSPSAPASKFAWSTAVVWIVWLALFAFAARGIALYASPFPRWDDLGWVEALSPGAGIDLHWLWSAHNEHRIPLPRLIGVPIVRLADDMRAALYFDAALLAAMAAATIVTLRKLRGTTELGDAAFALLWLTPGAARILLVLQGISYFVPIALLSTILVLLLVKCASPGPRRSLVIGILVCLLPLCGGPGLTTAPVLAVWMCGAGWLLRRSPRAEDRRSGLVLWACAAAAVAVVALYFVGFERPPHAQWNPSFADVLLQAWKYLAVGLGPAAFRAWPWSGAAVVVFGATAAWALGRTWMREPQERVRVSGVAALVLSVVGMALATGQFRGAPGMESGFEPRYVPLAAVWWSCVLCAIVVYAPRIVGRCAGLGLVAILLAFLPFHLKFLRAAGEPCREVRDAFAVDVAQGLDPEELVRRYPNCFLQDPAIFAEKLRVMHDLGMWPALVEYSRARARGPERNRVSPRRIESPHPVSYRWLDKDFVLIGAADHALVCAPLPAARRFSGRFGIHPATFARLGADGVRFTIEAVRPGASAELLFERTLRSDGASADRGFQSFSIALPPESAEAELTLRASRQGAAEGAPPFAFWADLRAE